MSANLAEKIQLGLDELAVIKGMMSPLIAAQKSRSCL